MEKNQTIPKLLRLYIIRHGQTVDNITHILQGQQPGRLTEEGILEAQKTGKFLKDIKFDFAYVSDLRRTVDSFENINLHILEENQLEKNNEKQVKFTSLIREIKLGILEGKKNTEQFVKEQFKLMNKNFDYKVEGGESYNDVIQRAYQFFKEIIQNHLVNQMQPTQNQNQEIKKVMIISHKGFITKLMSQIYQNCSIHCDIRFKNSPLDNCEMFKIDIQLEQNEIGENNIPLIIGFEKLNSQLEDIDNLKYEEQNNLY
ncbi:hypothetical protein PPERSA_12068 [Pseudocohnilembus persalinus]|uniref:Histidine phosphatase superfamily, clade-1 n=1 Tax=Pseudocohnilembus persalinus TaxID=266149 RepID=A0A0V0R993_PSEPJ|nr:hypothetical protein PPERSA_12068 [Pseudocohnilembus persalinus]|eukprot:KRX10944.1 hypothetical protein PPERSA_12068 [Pseudocohnilembus persalinus]